MSSRRKFVSAGAAAVFAVGLSAVTLTARADDDAGGRGSPGVGDRLFPALGNGGYDAAAYDVALDYEPAVTTMAGTVTMRATARQALTSFHLDSAGQRISAVTVDGRPATFGTDAEELSITPAKPLRAGASFTTTVRFTADRAQNPPSAAFPPLPGDTESLIRNWVGTPDGFALMGQPDRAHLFFPCNDHPSDKALFTFRVSVPPGRTVIANGRLAGKSTAGGRTTFVYRSEHPMATDVVQIAVGDFAVRETRTKSGLPLRAAVPAKRAADVGKPVAGLADQISRLERMLGRPFPFEQYGALVVPSDYNGVALETQTISTYSEGVLDQTAEEFSSLATHELVHQYFGDSVSVATWSDMWLSEGHATFYQSVPFGGGATAPAEESMRATYAADQDNREQWGPPAAPRDPRAVLFGTNETGMLALYALRQEIGAAKFREVERTFLERFRDRSASTQDYIATANAVSGRDLTAFLTAWLTGPTTPPMPGHPDWQR